MGFVRINHRTRCQENSISGEHYFLGSVLQAGCQAATFTRGAFNPFHSFVPDGRVHAPFWSLSILGRSANAIRKSRVLERAKKPPGDFAESPTVNAHRRGGAMIPIESIHLTNPFCLSVFRSRTYEYYPRECTVVNC